MAKLRIAFHQFLFPNARFFGRSVVCHWHRRPYRNSTRPNSEIPALHHEIRQDQSGGEERLTIRTSRSLCRCGKGDSRLLNGITDIFVTT